jgi:hypothetical protein
MIRSINIRATGALAAFILTIVINGSSISSKADARGEALLRVPVSQSSSSWSFGVMADTQWIGADDGRNPNSVAVDIINQLNREFIKKGVKFVVQVGDITDKGTDVALDTRATYAQELYNAGIGFFPLRGNHESKQAAAVEFTRVFPQTQNGSNNSTPSDSFVTTTDDEATRPAKKTGSPFTLGSNFRSPAENLKGLSYSFDYSNARFVLLDQFTPPDNAPNTIDNQQDWINNVLSSRAAGSHAFVFAHKGLITESHVDTLFGSDPSKDAAGQDAFITNLAHNGVRYFMGGHDHMYNRSVVTTTDGAASVIDIICASDSSKFYIPKNPSNDDAYDVPAFGRRRQIQLAQELNTIGYYIFTVNGPNVTADYYSAPVDANFAAKEYTIPTTGPLVFSKHDTFGYSLNGREFQIAPGESYTNILDKSPTGTVAKVLAGQYGSSIKDGSDRLCSHVVDTAWLPKTTGLYSGIFTIWGMADLNSSQKDAFVLSMSYDPKVISDDQAKTGQVGLASKAEGFWSNAVNATGGIKKFVIGAYDPSYGLGTYGLDLRTHTFWAVINFNGDFAVAPGM